MPSYAFFQKQFILLPEAKIGVMTHSLHYGTAIFEGIRGNWNSEHKQIYLFRLKEHYQRLQNGCRILRGRYCDVGYQRLWNRCKLVFRE